MHRTPHRSLLTAVAPLIVAGTLALAATAAAAGLEPAKPTPIPDSAFVPVAIPAPAAGRLALPSARAVGTPPSASNQTTDGIDDTADESTDLTGDTLAALAEDQPERAQPDVREPDRIVVEIPPPKPPTSHVLRGQASWYCRAGVSPCTYTHPDGGGFDAYAAAGPKLRAAIGPSWRGTIIYVNGVRVKLIDWCQCYKGEPHEKLLDLYYDVYARTGGSVTIRW